MFQAAINLEGGKVVHYHLDESKNWDIDIKSYLTFFKNLQFL